MGKSDNCTVEMRKRRKMRNDRKKRRRKQRAIMKRAVASKAVAEKIAESVRKQKLIAENYCAKWREICKQSKFRRQVTEQIIVHFNLI